MSIRRVTFTSVQNLKPPFLCQYLIFFNDFFFYFRDFIWKFEENGRSEVYGNLKLRILYWFKKLKIRKLANCIIAHAFFVYCQK